MAIVYTLSSGKAPEQIRYVGRTKHSDPAKRLKDHLWNAKKGKPYHVYNWIRQVQSNGDFIVISIVEEDLSWEDSAIAEMRHIETLRSQGYDLTNMTLGGEGSLGVIRSEEYRRKLSASHKGKVFSSEHLENLRQVWIGRSHSLETKAKISQSQKGRTFSEETRRKMSIAAQNRKPKGIKT